jgi:Trk K+ transport system NAD-binding subunit
LRSLLQSPLRNLLGGVLFMLVVALLSTLAYVAAGWNLGDAFYMVVLTVYTVGFDEVQPVNTTLLRTITITTIILGCTGMLFLTGALVQFITFNQFQQIFGRQRMKSSIDKLSRHIIICGFGRIGVMLAQELRKGGANFVIIERDEARFEEASSLNYLWVHGDATDEDVLKEAGITRARLVATVLPNDAANVFITLSARSLNKSLEIIARGEAPSTERKLLQAGANQVVLPTHIGAERIAEMILYNETSQFFRGSERMRDFEQTLHMLGLELELVVAAPGSAYVGETIDTVEQRSGGTFFIVQLHRRGNQTLTHPAADTIIDAGDGMVIVGRSGRLGALIAGGN